LRLPERLFAARSRVSARFGAFSVLLAGYFPWCRRARLRQLALSVAQRSTTGYDAAESTQRVTMGTSSNDRDVLRQR
jgi:hypothetical protein